MGITLRVMSYKFCLRPVAVPFLAALMLLMISVPALAAPHDDNPPAVLEGGTISDFNVLENDTGDEIFIVSFTQPQHGTANINLIGRLTYNHDDSETQSDSLTYTSFSGTFPVRVRVRDPHGGLSEPFDLAVQVE